METEELKRVDMKWIEALNARNWPAMEQVIDEVYPAEWVMHNPSFPDLPHTQETMKKWASELLKEMPDVHIFVEDSIAEGSQVVMRGYITGTNATTKEPFDMQFIHISRYVDGKMVEEWEYDIPGKAA